MSKPEKGITMSNSKVPTRIIDKNGKETTVHKSVDANPSSILGRVAPKPIQKSIRPLTLVDDQLELISLLQDASSLSWGQGENFEITVNEAGKYEVSNVVDADGASVWNQSNNSNEDDFKRMNLYLATIDVPRAVEAGLIDSNNGTLLVQRDTVEKFSNYN